MKMALAVTHHDHDFVEREGGVALYTHLRGATPRAAFRAGAIERSWNAYRRITRSRPSPEQGGAGLTVLQRAFMALEDLGLLLHAFSQEKPWVALRQGRLEEIDAAFAAAAADPDAALERLGLPSRERIAEEVSGAAGEVAVRLREIFVRQSAPALVRAELLWRTHRTLARATMHSSPILAGETITEPPGAGEVGEGVVPPPASPFAVAVISRVRGQEVTTERQIVGLDPETIGHVREVGVEAAQLGGELASLKAEAIRSGAGAALPLGLRKRLSGPEREALEALRRRARPAARASHQGGNPPNVDLGPLRRGCYFAAGTRMFAPSCIPG